jgi:RNA polymerase sigma-70 factor, ECF subfamily
MAIGTGTAMKMPWTTEPSERDPADDEHLVAAARSDPSAFAELYERYRPEIYAFVFRRVSDPDRAEDVTSQVFLRAMHGLSTYRSGSFRGWLYQIARNAITDSYRRERPTTSDAALAAHADPGPGPLELAEAREARERLHAILDQLTDGQRDVIHLRLKGYTGQEIADELGMGLNAVKSAQFRAFAKIRGLMEASPQRSIMGHLRTHRPNR